MLESSLARLRASFGAAVVGMLLAATASVPAAASPGYELDPVKPSISLGGEVAHGVAIDQTSQAIYVTELSTNVFNSAHGRIEQFDSSGSPTANSPFVTGGTDFFTGVAVNPLTHGVYGYQTQLTSPAGLVGASQINTFSSTGVAGSSFSPSKSTASQIAADSSGRIYFPNETTDTVQVFSSAGTLEKTISCSGCEGGGFGWPAAAALDSAENLYVVDLANSGRVIKFKPSAGSYAYDSVLQSGDGAVAVAVDPASNDVFVGDYVEGDYHVIAYDSSGVQFDDFGGGIMGSPPFGIESAGQIAASATSHKVYVSDPTAKKLWIFNRIASIPAPTASTSPPSPLGQVEATLNALVNPKGHGLSDCHFEYTDHVDFLAHDFDNATAVPCSFKPVGSSSTTASASVDGLTPATSYDYRIAVTSNGGSAEGSDQQFETLPPLAPTVATGSASAITQTTATIGGTVNPRGGPISNCHFEYVDLAEFQKTSFENASSVDCLLTPSGTVSTAVSAKVKSLAAGTEYSFRVVATNNSGTSEATSKTFATLAETCATNPALCPPPEEEEDKVAPPPTPGVQLPAPVPPPSPTIPAKPLKCRKGFKKKVVHGKPKCVKAKKPKHHRR
jgi:hypothetical protein